MSNDEGKNYLDGAAGNPFARGAGQIGYQNYQAAQKRQQSIPSVSSTSSSGSSGGSGSNFVDELIGYSDWIFDPVDEYFENRLPYWVKIAFQLISACLCAYYGAGAFLSDSYPRVQPFSFPLSDEAGAFWIFAGFIWVLVFAIAVWVLEVCYYLFRFGLGLLLLLFVMAASVAAFAAVLYVISLFI